MSMWRIQTRSGTVAAFIEHGNTALIILMALFAAFGIAAIFSKRLRDKAGLILSAFCVSAVAAFALEATVLNFMHYLKFFAGPQTQIATVSEENPNIVITTDGTYAELIGENEIRFKNLNRKVYSVFIDMEFNGFETADVTLVYTDDASTNKYGKSLYNFLPHENYLPLQPCGKVYDLSIVFTEKLGPDVILRNVVINKPIPIYFSGLRILAVSCLLFALFAVINKKLRAKAAYRLFEYKFDPKNWKQNIIYVCAVVLLILYCWACVYTSVSWKEEHRPNNFIYQRLLVDALIEGRTNLDYGNPRQLLALERPYEVNARTAAGFNEAWDYSWYKGKYYCYFGVVPAALFNVPYKLISGEYLPDYVSVFFYCAVSVILLAALWRHLCKKYMPSIRYALYLLSFLTLFFAGGIFLNTRWPSFYSVVRSAGIMFTLSGVLLLLKSVDSGKVKHVYLFFAALCLALVFGCRPNIGIASLLVPVVLWKYRSWKLATFTLIPYIMIAIPLCYYNYIRFGSIFEFGVNYMLNHVNTEAFAQMNVFSKIFKAFYGMAHYLICPVTYSLQFPYVSMKTGDTLQITMGMFWYYVNACAMINFPIVFMLFYMFKKDKPKMFRVLYASLIIAVFIMLLNSYVAGCFCSYTSDFALFIIFPAFICAYYWCFDAGKQSASGERVLVGQYVRLGVTYTLLTVCVFVGLCLCVSMTSSYSNATLYRYLEYSFGFFRNN